MLKCGKLPAKQVTTKAWEWLCADLTGPHTLKGKDGSQMDFVCLTVIDPATSWFEIEELPAVEVPADAQGVTNREIFDKTSKQIA